MITYILFNRKALPVEVTMIYDPEINLITYHAYCTETYECEDGIARSFTGSGYTLINVLAEVGEKMHEHKPVATRKN